MNLFELGDYVFATDDHDMPYKRLRVIHEITADGKYVAVPIETIVGISFDAHQLVKATESDISMYSPIDPRKDYRASQIERPENPFLGYDLEE